MEQSDGSGLKIQVLSHVFSGMGTPPPPSGSEVGEVGLVGVGAVVICGTTDTE